MESEVVQRARRLADEVLFPAAVEVDRADRVPAAVLDALAQNGFYGLGAPPELSGLDLPDDAARAAVVEAFAGGCLPAAFVWLQHRGALRAVVSAAAGHASPTVEQYLPALIAGRLRAGPAIGAATRTGPAVIRAVAEPGGAWRFSGRAPWVTGWGMVDVLLMAGRDPSDRLVWALVSVDSPGLRAKPLDLVAVQASGTVTLAVDDVRVPAKQVLSVEPHAAYLARDAESLSSNGFLAIGLTGRAITLLRAATPGTAHVHPGSPVEALTGDLDRTRERLLTAGADDAPSARAAASDLALRAAAALAVHEGSRSVLARSHAARLIREATFLLNFSTRPAIRERLLSRLARPPAARPW